MAFKYEEMTETDKKFINSFEFLMPIGNREERARIPEKWAVDRERGYYIICLAGRGYCFNNEYPPYYYRLIVNNAVIEIEARFQSEGNYDSGVAMTWRLEGIFVPDSLQNISENEILKIVKEAITAYGNVHKNGHVISTMFDKDEYVICENKIKEKNNG